MDPAEVPPTLAAEIDRVKRNGAVLVGIDGIDAAGKTTLADELVRPLEALRRHVVRASLDGFHNPRERRLARGEFSPEGYFHDSFDYAPLVDRFIKPAKTARHRTTLRAATFDVRTDREVDDITVEIHARSIVLFDGIFLFRPELVSFWDYRIFVEIGFDTSLARGIARDAASMGGEAAARDRYLRRYIPGQRLYFEAARPVELADAVVRNDDPARRRIVLASQTGALSPADG
jgi:uridine kinase